MCIYFRFTLTKTKVQQTIDDKMLDLDLVSVEDYSVTGKISKQLYDQALTKVLGPSDQSEQSNIENIQASIPINRFKKYIVDNIQ